MTKEITLWPASGLLLLTLTFGCTPVAKQEIPTDSGIPGLVTDARWQQADREPHNWLGVGRTYEEQRYSPLTQISDRNVDDLGLAWVYDMGSKAGGSATPVIVDGVMYITGPWSVVYALDAGTGKQLWSYDPRVNPEDGARGCCGVTNRGLAVYEGKVYVGVFDARLVALDAEDGSVVWEVNTNERDNERRTITGAPRVANGRVIIGHGGAEFGVRGYVTAYDAKNGEQLWRFYTVPGNPEKGFESKAMAEAAKTWTGEWWTQGGGGTVWDSMVYDPTTDVIFLGTGNGSPWNRRIRSPQGGDNLYLSSIVAVNAKTGEYLWHYQTTPGESWDYTATQPLLLATLEIDDKPRDVIMQAPKNGFFYVLDRQTGELLSADKFTKVTWASHVDMNTGRPVETENARYENGPQLAFPSPFGAHNWHPMSYSPDTGLVYIPHQQVPWVYSDEENYEAKPGTIFNLGLKWPDYPEDPEVLEQILPMIKGSLVAWDPVKQEKAWEVEYPTIWNGGTVTSAGNLVFQGTPTGQLYAYKADTGERVWSYNLGIGIVAAPAIYAINGEQYLSVLTGVGGALSRIAGPFAAAYQARHSNRVYTFKLGGTATNPPLPERRPQPPLNPPARNAGTDAVDAGRDLYARSCMRCHGEGAIAGLMDDIPDLRHSPLLHSGPGFEITVLNGRDGTYMPGFASQLTSAEIEQIRSYLVKRAHDALDQEKDQ
ncbi:MAG: PQQ-dependent dehydrogenase, methanol/ethanol family [Marinobacter sp.]|nr:PQQ-dependent dehydrogenase, methanol/ethanol family [Marinobacter sp.]